MNERIKINFAILILKMLRLLIEVIVSRDNREARKLTEDANIMAGALEDMDRAAYKKQNNITDAPEPKRLTRFQIQSLDRNEHGMGISAAPGDITKQQRKELDELVEWGLMTKGKNHSKDKHGCYQKP